MMSQLPLWMLGLGTQLSAERACRWGGIACFVMAARITVGNLITLYAADKPIDSAIAWLIGASLFPALFVFAGFRLRQFHGQASSILASGLVIIDPLVFGHDVSTAIGINMLIARYLLVLLILNGTRASFALNRTPTPWKEVLG